MCATDKRKCYSEVAEVPGAREAVVPMLGTPRVWESLARDMFMQTSHGDNMSIQQNIQLIRISQSLPPSFVTRTIGPCAGLIVWSVSLCVRRIICKLLEIKNHEQMELLRV